MKLSKRLFMLMSCAFMITACDGTTNSSGLKPVDGITGIDDIVIDDNDTEEETIVTKTVEEITSGQLGGSLTDLLVGSYIEPQYSYTCSFSHTHTFDGEYTVKSDDRTIAQVTHEAGTNSFTVKGITPGDAIIQATTSDEEVVLQFVVHVRKRIPMNKIAEQLYKVDVFTGMFYGYKISFLDDEPLKAVLTGSDDFETSYVNFTLIDGVEERIGDGIDFNTYKFKISVDTETSSTSRSYTDLYVSTTGDKIFMYYSNGIVDIFTSNSFDIYGNTAK